MWKLLDGTQVQGWLESPLKLDNYTWQKNHNIYISHHHLWLLFVCTYQSTTSLEKVLFVWLDNPIWYWNFHIFNICAEWNTNVSHICHQLMMVEAYVRTSGASYSSIWQFSIMCYLQMCLNILTLFDYYTTWITLNPKCFDISQLYVVFECASIS